MVGAGLYNAVFAHMANKQGKRCMVIERRQHTGGNIHCNETEGICVHQYGPHIFHTSNSEIWNFVNSFVQFNRFTLNTIANYRGEIYNLPFNMNTFNRIWNITTPEEAKRKINEQSERYRITSEPRNLEEQAIRMVGTDIYERLIKEYTEKQWGKPCNQLPPSIIKRLPIRFVYDNNYFDDIYQGIPEGGYNRLIDRLLQGIECRTNCDYLQNREYYNRIAKTIVYSGAIDEFYGFCFGRLEYRSLRFENETLPVSNYQGNAIVNYTSANEPYTRIVEHKHFDINNTEVYRSRKTIITREYPMPYFTKKNAEPYYPINDERNDKLYAKYKELARNEKNIIFGGRLAEYKYYDMDDVIESSISSFKHATELAEIKI